MRQEHTIHDIAREAGVSAATVSRVLTGSAGVKADKAARVREVIERMGYRPNPLARGLLGLGTRAVGVLVPQLEDEFYGRIVTGLEGRLRQHGLHMICSLGHSQRESEQAALENLRERQVDGLVMMADHLPDEQVLELAAQGIPLVLINRHIPELQAHCVRLDNVRGGYLATRHLIELGHTRIAHIAGSLQRPGARERLEGYRMALLEAKLPTDESLIVEGDFTEDGGRRAVERMLRRACFSALFAASDRMALGAMLGLREAGLEIPKQVSIVGFDDRTLARYTFPALTTLHYPMHEMGSLAADHLAALLANKNPNPLPLLEPELVGRASTVSQKGGQ